MLVKSNYNFLIFLILIHFLVKIIISSLVPISSEDLLPNNFYFVDLFTYDFNSVKDIFISIFIDNYFIESKVYIFVHSLLYHFFDSFFLNHLYEIFIHTSIVVLIFKLSKLSYITNKQLLFLYLLFPTFSFSFFYLRDSTILLLLLYHLYYIQAQKKFSLALLISGLIFLLVLDFRVETSLLIIAQTLVYYYYLKKEKSKNFFLFLILLFFVLIYILSLSQDFINNLISGYNVYDTLTTERMDNTGLGSKLYNLPKPLSNILILFFGLLNIPPWSNIGKSINLFGEFRGFLFLFNFLFSGILIFNVLFNFSRFRKLIKDLKLNLYLLVILFYGLASTVNFTYRRTLVLFLFVFIFWLHKGTSRKAIVAYSCFLIFYTALKFYI
jgi:hypothetical protein